MQRPPLTTNLSPTDFRDFYWLKEELVTFCRQHSIPAAGSKTALAERIGDFLLTGSVPQTAAKQAAKQRSTFNWTEEPLTGATLITGSYRNTENVRAFFTGAIGRQFSFNVRFMDWMKTAAGKTLGEAAEEWRQLDRLRKDPAHQTEIAPQFEYNRYLRAFLTDNPALGSRDAIRCWKLKRAQRGSHEYNRDDLELR